MQNVQNVNNRFLKSLLNQNFLDFFWFELSQMRYSTKEKAKVFSSVTERDCQRVFVMVMRCYHSKFFTRLISDIPGMVNSVGYDIEIVTPSTKIYIDAKMAKKSKKQNSQISLEIETKPFDFIEYAFLYFDLENKKINIK